MSQFLQLGFTKKCNKTRQQTYDVMGGTPLRDRRGGRFPQRDRKALLISPALIYARRIGQVQVGPKETNLIGPNTPLHYELKPPASIVQLNGTVQANILFQELYLISTTSRLRRHVLEYNQISKFALKSKLGEVAVRLKPPLIRGKHVFPQEWKRGQRYGTLAILGAADNNTVRGVRIQSRQQSEDHLP